MPLSVPMSVSVYIGGFFRTEILKILHAFLSVSIAQQTKQANLP